MSRAGAKKKSESESFTNVHVDQDHESIEPPDREQAGVYQNPIYIPSIYTEDWSADSLDGAVSATYDSKEPQECSHDTSLII